MAVKKQKFSPQESRILRILNLYGGSLTTREVSLHSDISYASTVKNLKSLKKKKKVSFEEKGNRIYWELV